MSMHTIPGSSGAIIFIAQDGLVSVFNCGLFFIRLWIARSRYVFAKTNRLASHRKGNQRRNK